MNHTLYPRFLSGLRWNTLESVVYHAIFIAHQSMLYHILPIKEYGLIGTIFSGIYLVVACANLGLDVVIMSFFDQISRSKRNAFHLFILPLLAQIILYIVVAGGIIQVISLFLPQAEWYAFGRVQLLTFILLIALEGTKRSLRVALHLIFRNQVTALVELAHIIAYATSIWGFYLIFKTIPIQLIFMSLAVISLLANSILGLYLYQWYATLPEDDVSTVSLPNWLRSRLLATCYQVSHALVSPNALVTASAALQGLAWTGNLKFISSIIHTMSTIVYKSVGASSQALFAALKNDSSVDHAPLFAFLNRIAYALFILITFGCLVTFCLSALPGTLNNWWIIGIVLALYSTETLFIPYEMFCLVHEKYQSVLFWYGLPLAFWSCITWIHSPLFILFGLVLLRIIMLVSLYKATHTFSKTR